MGAWSAGNFGNDTALDFVDDLKDFGTLRATLTEIAANPEQMDADTACIALAASDLLAAIIGRAPADAPELPDFAKDDVTGDLLDLATSLVRRVRDTSELAALWAEDDADIAEWHDVLDATLVRLDPSQPYVAPKTPPKPDLPHDFLGYCYVCYSMVTKRDGLLFEHAEEGCGTISVHPHRACIEAKISEAGPYWLPDGSPTEVTRTQLLRDIGYDI